MTPLMIMLVAMAGPLLAVFDSHGEDEDDLEGDEAAPPPGPVGIEGTPLEFRSVEARGSTAGDTPLNVDRGTDADEVFEGSDAVRNFIDFSGGMDTMTGGLRDDTLIGGDGADVIAGGGGDDALFGGFRVLTREDDMDADTLDGGEGDDSLFLGDDDTGAGGDAFVVIGDVSGNVTVTDFNRDEDGLVIETDTPETTGVSDQTVTTAGLVITLTTGATITLQGVTEEVPDAWIRVLDPAA
ncbi:calcium-binding protein [Sulfitobacter sabulilitoris]|uniref:Calcium-binding protein n=1 Tax=Sulfitobacter sabulilitoris TaxID=2562655 RepID=A0A5S3PBA5_9RHOB|nr:calcium-binding protein [Sulfitobacter sabulilitoris]TMM50896.1 calcium-binding protein [Sulfitobacter sabulilitoris]